MMESTVYLCGFNVTLCDAMAPSLYTPLPVSKA